MKGLKSGPALLTVEVDADLAKRVAAISRENGISTSKYINNLLESALNSEDTLARQQALDEKRDKAADRAWEKHKFPKNIQIEASNGWDIVYGSYQRDFFYHDANVPSDETLKGWFSLSFEDDSAKPEKVNAFNIDGDKI
jgi:hypothetical protein